MRDSYVADVGGFGKYALLNALADNDLRLGVLWRRNSEPDATEAGCSAVYPELRACDLNLYDRLAQILQDRQRSPPGRRNRKSCERERFNRNSKSTEAPG